jgi:sterol desaturase/sphingolipid hydroxylase (fatty acid hydroxylase superfamily)
VDRAITLMQDDLIMPALLLFLLDDFIYYWFHRANHEVRFMWAGHVNHHSSRFMNFGTALRQGVGERVSKYFFWLPLPLLGFEPAMVITMMSVSLSYQFWIHTRAVGRLHPWIGFIFNTPSHHRVHHASNVRYLDCNHGGTLIIWDRLFGTFSKELDAEPVVYGLTHNIHTFNPTTASTTGHGPTGERKPSNSAATASMPCSRWAARKPWKTRLPPFATAAISTSSAT